MIAAFGLVLGVLIGLLVQPVVPMWLQPYSRSRWWRH